MPTSPIVYELGLVIVALVVFVVWQTVTLRRDMRITRQRKAETARLDARQRADPAHRAAGAAAQGSQGPPRGDAAATTAASASAPTPGSTPAPTPASGASNAPPR
jgi:hypothetical protein